MKISKSENDYFYVIVSSLDLEFSTDTSVRGVFSDEHEAKATFDEVVKQDYSDDYVSLLKIPANKVSWRMTKDGQNKDVLELEDLAETVKTVNIAKLHHLEPLWTEL